MTKIIQIVMLKDFPHPKSICKKILIQDSSKIL